MIVAREYAARQMEGGDLDRERDSAEPCNELG
jgi:hypothetical protein